MKKLKKGEAKKIRKAVEVKARSATPKKRSLLPHARTKIPAQTSIQPPVQVLKPSYPTTVGGVRIVLDLDDLARTLNFIDLGTNNEILPAFLKMLKPWGLSDAVLERFRRISETGAP